jgi:hypothetical protein
MSFLAPLYLLGALAVSLPVLLHLIRRTPRGRQPFSSLMFLSPSPPRITRRSRIEHWLLLLLRAAALILLALAFGRPFLRESANLALDSGIGRRLAIVVDTSASMRRGDLWRQVTARVERLLEQLGPADEVGLFAYDDNVRPIVDWDEPLDDLAARRVRVRTAVSELSPTWGSSNVGQALATVADRLAAAVAERRDDRPSEMVVISDLQSGSDTSALQAFEWPAEVMLQFQIVQPSSPDNAGVRLLEDDDEQPGWRVRVLNAAGATVEQFRVSWGGMPGEAGREEVGIYVPAGQSRVVRLSAPPPGANRVSVSGDAYDFDNEFFFAPIHQRALHVAYVGADAADDPRGLRYFLERVWTETPRRKVIVEALSPESPLDRVEANSHPMMVVSTPLPAAGLDTMRSYVRGGGTALLVIGDRETAESLVALVNGVRHTTAEVPASSSGTTSAAYALLSEIDFRHPVFASFAGPRYNDFTKVRFWRHQRFELDESAQARVLARFDNGDPAIWEQQVGSGKLLWLACGWRPSDSQLALSSKFVPMLSRVLDHLTGIDSRPPASWRVDEPVLLPAAAEPAEGIVTRPDGQFASLPPGAERFRDASQPGVYRLQRGAGSVEFAVNLDPAESDTAALSPDHFEQLGVRLGRGPTREERLERQRQMRDTELESRQKLWRWILIGVLGVLAVETVLAGRTARQAERHDDLTETAGAA